MTKLLFAISGWIGLLVLTGASSSFADPAGTYHDGDIVGISELNVDPTTVFFEVATGTRYGHIGVIFNLNGQWSVYEETPPSARVTPIADFLARAKGPTAKVADYAVIRSNKMLTAAQTSAIRAAAQDIVNRAVPYNFTQAMNPDSLDCSEFVYKVFAAGGISVGKIQQAGDLNIHAFHNFFWKEMNAAGPVPLHVSVVTPASIMATPRWSKVDGPLSPTAVYSDQELYDQWDKEGLIPMIEAPYDDLTEGELAQLAKPTPQPKNK
jgi:hypothetical protein